MNETFSLQSEATETYKDSGNNTYPKYTGGTQFDYPFSQNEVNTMMEGGYNRDVYTERSFLPSNWDSYPVSSMNATRKNIVISFFMVIPLFAMLLSCLNTIYLTVQNKFWRLTGFIH